ncbi:MAG: hypothetical protein HKP37_12480 [Boseongicola sp.]|nr:hypothetical protein [Boseongicola sp.]
MLETIVVIAMLQSVESLPEGIHCEFPSVPDGGKAMSVVLDPMPSLKDQPGLYRVMMEIEGKLTLKAAVQPIHSTDERDVLIHAKSPRSAVVTLGMRDDGAAALTLSTPGESSAEAQSTRIGACKGAEQHINRWLPS